MTSEQSDRIEVLVDDDDIYEKPGLGRKVFNRLLWYPFVNLVPQHWGIWLFTNSCEHTRLIRENSKTHKALELLYTYQGFSLNGKGAIDSVLTSFWEANTVNAHAVRNRLRLVKKELRKAIEERRSEQKIKILSLASGSARAVIEIIAEFRNVPIEARFVDISREALQYSRGLAAEYRIQGKITWVRDDMFFLLEYQPIHTTFKV